MSYATPEDFSTYTGGQTATGQTLRSASRVIEHAVRLSVYDPEDATIGQALREATIEQAIYWAETGDTGTGAAGEWQSASIGGASYTKASGAAATKPGHIAIAPQARMILATAGLLRSTVIVRG